MQMNMAGTSAPLVEWDITNDQRNPMEYPPDQFTFYACQTIYVSIIGDLPPSRRVVASFSCRDALDELIAYLNMMVAETVLPGDAEGRDGGSNE